MHVLQPKLFKLKEADVEKLLEKYNIALSQLPKISSTDPLLPEGAQTGDVFRFEREREGEVEEYFRAVI